MAKGKIQDGQSDNIPSTKRGLQTGYNRVTYIVKDETAYKLEFIATRDRLFIKNVVNEALENHIGVWEKKNEKIPEMKKK